MAAGAPLMREPLRALLARLGDEVTVPAVLYLRGFKSDLDDIRFLVDRGLIALDELAVPAQAMLKEAARYLIDAVGVEARLAALRASSDDDQEGL